MPVVDVTGIRRRAGGAGLVARMLAEDGWPVTLVTVPVVFGTALVPGYRGFQLRMVQPGDTLSAIAEEFYGDATLYPRIFEANRNQVADPNLIFPGQSLRVPLT